MFEKSLHGLPTPALAGHSEEFAVVFGLGESGNSRPLAHSGVTWRLREGESIQLLVQSAMAERSVQRIKSRELGSRRRQSVPLVAFALHLRQTYRLEIFGTCFGNLIRLR